MSVTIWHNTRCSKSRQTLALLQERGIDVEIFKYLDSPPSRDQILDVSRKLNRPLIDMVRTKDAAFKELNLASNIDTDDLLDAMAAHPQILERPVVITENAARLGRPPEDVLELF